MDEQGIKELDEIAQKDSMFVKNDRLSPEKKEADGEVCLVRRKNKR